MIAVKRGTWRSTWRGFWRDFWTLDTLTKLSSDLVLSNGSNAHPTFIDFDGPFWHVEKKMRHSENNSYHLINKKALKLTLYKKRFSCICSYFWEYSQTNDERTKFLMKTARAPPNRRIKVCEISKKSLQMQKHLKKFLDLLFVEKILISNQINSLTYQFPDTFFTLLPH